MTPPIVVIDGVDGSGKTSIASRLASRLGGRCVKPFGGGTGLRIRKLNESGAKAAAEELARRAAHETVLRNGDACVLVFDRHWMSILAYISEEFAANWEPFPPTVLIRAEPEVLAERLRARGTPDHEVAGIAEYARRYDQLALRFAVPSVDTTSLAPDETLQIILSSSWLPPIVSGRPTA